MIERIEISNGIAVEIWWNQTEILAVADLGNNNGCLLDYFDSVKDARKAVKHFEQAYTVAREEGFVLMPGSFVHREIECGVTVAEGLAVGESLEGFRATLRRFKRGLQAVQ